MPPGSRCSRRGVSTPDTPPKEAKKEEKKREEFALAEKARRLAKLQEEHKAVVAARHQKATRGWETSEFARLHQRLGPGGRVQPRATGRDLSWTRPAQKEKIT